MSAHAAPRTRVTLAGLAAKKAAGEPIVMVTAYDHPSAQIAEAAGVDPCDAAPDHWRHVANRIAAGHQPRPYTLERHRAWLKRREIEG